MRGKEPPEPGQRNDAPCSAERLTDSWRSLREILPQPPDNREKFLEFVRALDGQFPVNTLAGLRE
jgi:hypothetical protein